MAAEFYTRVQKRKDCSFVIIPKEYVKAMELKKGDYLRLSIEDVVYSSDRNDLEN